mgnify:FL=1
MVGRQFGSCTVLCPSIHASSLRSSLYSCDDVRQRDNHPSTYRLPRFPKTLYGDSTLVTSDGDSDSPRNAAQSTISKSDQPSTKLLSLLAKWTALAVGLIASFSCPKCLV